MLWFWQALAAEKQKLLLLALRSLFHQERHPIGFRF